MVVKEYMNMSIDHFKALKNLILESEKSGVLFKGKKLSGFSGETLMGTLQRIAAYQESAGAGCYLEIGVFQGLTLLSVAGVLKTTKAYGIDNFSHHDKQGLNQSKVHDSAAANDLKNYVLINSDYEDALENLGKHIGDSKVGTFFIDGPHDYRSQLMCLELAIPFLSNLAVIIIDDSNYRHVRLANRDFLVTHPEFKLLYESYTECHPANMDAATEAVARKGWWDGVNIIVHDPENQLASLMPDTIRSRDLYENDHYVHCARYGFLAPEAVFFIQALMSFRLIRAAKEIVKMIRKLRVVNRSELGAYDRMNTYSKGVPTKMNPALK
jgi:hypothetical protein